MTTIGLRIVRQGRMFVLTYRANMNESEALKSRSIEVAMELMRNVLMTMLEPSVVASTLI
jgi:hypothetical protein